MYYRLLRTGRVAAVYLHLPAVQAGDSICYSYNILIR